MCVCVDVDVWVDVRRGLNRMTGFQGHYTRFHDGEFTGDLEDHVTPM